MVIERKKHEIIIRISDTIRDCDLQSLKDYISYIEATALSQATQKQADDFSNEVNSSWWSDNKDRLLAS